MCWAPRFFCGKCRKKQNLKGFWNLESREDNKLIQNFQTIQLYLKKKETAISQIFLQPDLSSRDPFPPNCHTSATGSGTSGGALTVALAASVSTTRCTAAASTALSAMTRSMSSGGEHSMWTWESKLGHQNSGMSDVTLENEWLKHPIHPHCVFIGEASRKVWNLWQFCSFRSKTCATKRVYSTEVPWPRFGHVYPLLEAAEMIRKWWSFIYSIHNGFWIVQM